jgi:hypothetical protein
VGRETNNLSLKLWLIVLLEVASPIPAFLTIGAIIVLLTKPPWFRQLVDDLYSE